MGVRASPPEDAVVVAKDAVTGVSGACGRAVPRRLQAQREAICG
jgi:hypothetical protein